MNDPRDGAPRTLDEWLRAAYAAGEAGAAGCPPPEAFLEAETAALAPEARQALEAHAERCPACAAERDLARLFDAAPAEAEVRPEDLAFVVSRLEETSPVRAAAPAASNVVPFPAPRRTEVDPAPARARSRPLLRYAAAALLVLSAGLGYQTFHTPDPALPEPGLGGVVRGGAVETEGPAGEIAEIPAELRWVDAEGAASYRVRMTAVDGSVLWETGVTAPPARLPAELTGRLHRAVVYTWTVEALDASGARLASSAPVRFQVRPEPEQP
jgi:hypothetical protein